MDRIMLARVIEPNLIAVVSGDLVSWLADRTKYSHRIEVLAIFPGDPEQAQTLKTHLRLVPALNHITLCSWTRELTIFLSLYRHEPELLSCEDLMRAYHDLLTHDIAPELPPAIF